MFLCAPRKVHVLIAESVLQYVLLGFWKKHENIIIVVVKDLGILFVIVIANALVSKYYM